MSNYYLEQTWRQKSDQELVEAGNKLSSYYGEARNLIISELQRRGLPDPPPISGEIPERSDSRALGVVMLVLGIIGSAIFLYSILFRPLKGGAFYCLGALVSFSIHGYRRIVENKKLKPTH